ncbi:MAG: type II secretion system protein N [Nitrospirota bacterium]
MRDIISYHFIKGENLKKHSSVNAAKAEKQKQLADYSLILNNNVFGFSAGEIKPLAASAGLPAFSASQTDIALLGTAVGPRELSFAIFRDGFGKQHLFKLGESVLGAGVLSLIRNDKVALKKGVRETEIFFEELNVKEIPRRGSSAAGFAQKVGSATYIVDQAKLQRIVSNPAQMMTDARLRPNVANGREEGFVLSEVKPGGIYHSLGLQNGDVLLRINEYDISNPERALQAFTALKGMDRVQVDMIRAGAKMTMTYQIR